MVGTAREPPATKSVAPVVMERVPLAMVPPLATVREFPAPAMVRVVLELSSLLLMLIVPPAELKVPSCAVVRLLLRLIVPLLDAWRSPLLVQLALLMVRVAPLRAWRAPELVKLPLQKVIVLPLVSEDIRPWLFRPAGQKLPEAEPL